MTTKLSLANLEQVKKTAGIPSYPRSALKAGIVHFGVGNFHRAHQAVYLDDALQRRTRPRLGDHRRRRAARPTRRCVRSSKARTI